MRCALFFAVVAWGCAGDSVAAVAAYATSPENGDAPAALQPTGDSVTPATPPAIHAASFQAPSAPAPTSVSPKPPQQPSALPSYDPMVDYALACPPNVTGARVESASTSHWFGGVDLGITEAIFSSGAFAIRDDEVSVSVRPYVGWEGPACGGLRVQAWIYDVKSEAIVATSHEPFELELDTYVIDVDYFRRVQLEAASLVLGAGARSAKSRFTFPNEAEDSWSGTGLSIFADGYHVLRVTPVSEWGWIGGGRLSYLDGDIGFLDDDPYPEADHILTIGEGYFGVQYRRHFAAADFVFQLRLERQVWRSNIVSDLAFNTSGFRFGWEW